MTRHDPAISMRQMLDHAREAALLAQGRKREDLDSDRSLNLSLVRLMEIIGEAANRVSEAERSRVRCSVAHCDRGPAAAHRRAQQGA